MWHKDSLIPRIMRAAKADTPLQVYGTGAQRRDFVHIDDVVAGLFAAWRTEHVGPLIIGSGRSVSVLDLVAEAAEVLGQPVRFEHVDAKPGEMPAVIVSIGQARKLGYEPSVALRDGLATVWNEFR
jgi:UDP-glucose 4-epimerase